MTARSLPAALIRESFVSISIASLIVFLWLLTAYIALFALPDAKNLSAVAVLTAIVVRSFLHTGLFILAHDAMHGTLMPAYPKVNDWAGRIILRMYSFLSFDMMQAYHHQHHRTPAQSTDPDFYLGGFWPWYFNFMRVYIQGGQGWTIFWGMSAFFYPMVLFMGVPVLNAALFWLLPQAISSWQLFYFGTYRPHKWPAEGHTNIHRANSSSATPLLSFFSCYHFDYHWEHHEYPHLPWYKLPSVHQQ
ncbi:MAG: fatty acid desaturase [Cyanobacteria bacterium P01_D01_bin.1]